MPRLGGITFPGDWQEPGGAPVSSLEVPRDGMGSGGSPTTAASTPLWVEVPQPGVPPAEPEQCGGLTTPLLGGILERGRSSPFLPACLLPAWERKERQGRALQLCVPNPPTHIHSLAASQPISSSSSTQGLGRHRALPTGQGVPQVPGLSIIHGEFGGLEGGGTPVPTPQLVPATLPAHPADAGAALGTWGVQEVASAHISVQWHWTLLPVCTGGTGDPHGFLAQEVGWVLAQDPSLGMQCGQRLLQVLRD